MKNLNRILRLQDSITRLALVRRLIDQAWPEVVGNQPEFSQDLGELYTKVNWLQDIANIKFSEAVEQGLHPTSETLPAQEALSTPEHSATSQS